MTREPGSGTARTGGVDTATRVLSVRDPETDVSGDERPDGPGAPGADGVPDAVSAAWVRRGGAPGDPDGEDAGSAGAGTGEDAGGSGAADAPAPAKVPSPARGDGATPAPSATAPAGAGESASGAPEAPGTPAASGDGGDTPSAAPEPGKDVTGTAKDTGTATGTGTAKDAGTDGPVAEDDDTAGDDVADGDDTGKAAPAATAKTAPGKAARTASEAAPKTPPAADAPTSANPAGKLGDTSAAPAKPAGKPAEAAAKPSEPAGKPADTSAEPAKPAGKAGDTPAPPAKPAGKAADAPAEPAKPTSEPAKPTSEPAKPTSEPAKPAHPAGDATAAPAETPGEDTPAKSASAPADKAPAPGAAVTPGADDDVPDDADTDADADAADTDADTDVTPDGDSGADSPGEPGADPGPEPLDHPTAVFKAVRPPKPEVDQPTTMLKLGTGAERASKFVALKPLDEPPARTPAEATAAVPQVGPELTRQQPLPPKPPLDLLAELTNTPPPPQTPVRTLVRRVKIWTPLVLLLILVFAIAQAFRPLPTPTLALTAEDSYTFDGSRAQLPWPSEGQGSLDVNGIGTMGAFGKQTPVAIGSVAKAMTAYVVLKDHPMKSGSDGAKITVDALAEKEGGYDKDGESTLNTVKTGDVLTQRDALSAIMIPSANNIARLLARWDSGSEADFIKKMNSTAEELGMKNTTYTDASGLKETTVSTAEDQVKLGNALVRIPALMEITKLPSWKDPSGQTWQNYNRLVPYNGALGIKTGTTTKAGGNLLFAATKDVDGQTVTVVGAILGQHTAPIIDTVNQVSKTAMIAAQDALKSAKILKKGDVVGYVDDQLGGHTPVVVTKDVSAVGWSGLKVRLSFDADDVPHTAKAGTTVGTLTVGDGDGGAVKVPVQLQSELAEPGLGAKLTRIT
ncbi:D-alanyl-D-alanine carboxypeptidase [Streptomyces doudnae]|uniref:serine-type D-Ala-D-Ala carboxypeptidase n=2 Tax=Streptomyces TaxID=1883 RepID=A0ABD5EXB0_9ACTN|nr:D-alanyl-D-alanine carboxypeptidase [Streptomyces sp. DSM 41981]MDT0438037.1 D-alanyl-D-alanine carboxypeptidase [Streptomyces sp. DSM 41981]